MIMDLVALQKFINKGVIDVQKRETTLFDIAGFPHREVVISNVYAYFLDPSKSHGLGRLFLDALQTLLPVQFNFEEVSVFTEQTVKDQKRLDILVSEPSESDQPKKVIIIENKMFHHVHNDLGAYYDHFKAEERFKQGVLLTIYPTEPDDKRFVNVTHQQWLNEVWDMVGAIIPKLSNDVLFMLKQFSTNLNNFNMSHEIEAYYEFYRGNYSDIIKINELKKALDSHIWGQVRDVPNHVSKLRLKVEDKSRFGYTYYYEEEVEEIWFTIMPDMEYKNTPTAKVYIELQGKALGNVDQLMKLNYTEEESGLLTPLSVETIQTKWKHWVAFATHIFKFEEKDLVGLGSRIAEKMESSPLLTIYHKIKNQQAL